MTAQPTDFKIYRYINPEFAAHPDDFPGHIIFPDSLNKSLPKQNTILDGERINSTWYDSWDNTNGFQDEIVKIDYVFFRDTDGFLEHKVKTVSWQLENDTWSPITQTDTIPVTSNTDRLEEIRKRRANVVVEVKGLAQDIGLAQGIKDIYNTYMNEVSLYIEAGEPDLKDAILADTTHTWLDNLTPYPPIIPIRTFLVAKFSVALST